MGSVFKKAQRGPKKSRLFLYAGSGHGKTYTSLVAGTAAREVFGENLVLLGSENNSATLYAEEFDFDYAPLDHADFLTRGVAKFSPENYIKAMDAASEAGYGIIIVDGVSPMWSWLVDQSQVLGRSKFGGNSWAAWSDLRPRVDAFVEAVIASPSHLILTARAKQLWDDGEKKGQKIRVGEAPRMSDEFIYEVDVAIQMFPGAVAVVDKTRANEVMPPDLNKTKPGVDFFRPFYEWISGDETESIYSYGDGTEVPSNAKSRRVFNQYVAAHNGDVPENREALAEWYEKQ